VSDTSRPQPEQAHPGADPGSRRRLLAAALDEFADKGFAGARVGEIAARAGVNKQLISYYFGGKEGLYRAVQALWLGRDARPDAKNRPPADAPAGRSEPLADIAAGYAEQALRDPRFVRLMLWRALGPQATPDSASATPDPAGLRARQDAGELPSDLDPRILLLVLIGLSTLPVGLRHQAEALTGLDIDSTEFRALYVEQVARIVAHLAPAPPPE